MSVSEANRKFFDDEYESKPSWKKVALQLTDLLHERLEWLDIGLTNVASDPHDDDVRLLDYACGTGLMSRIYGPYVTVTRALDVSPKMVEIYNSNARKAGVPETGIKAQVGDLLDRSKPATSELSTPEWYNFDLVAAGFAFHHFEDPVYAAKQFKERLRPGGSLVITDFLDGGDLKSDESGDPIPGTEGNHAVHHHHHSHHGHGQHGHGHPQHAQPHEQEQQQHGHSHTHGHHHGQSATSAQPGNQGPEKTPTQRDQDMKASIVIPSFTLEHVKKIFTDAGLVNVDAFAMSERVYLEIGEYKLWRTVLVAKGHRPADQKSEL